MAAVLRAVRPLVDIRAVSKIEPGDFLEVKGTDRQ